MPSFTTFYRAIVMVAAGVIVVKGWQLYGPPTDKVKSFGVRAMEMASAAWGNAQPTDSGPETRDDPRLAAAPPPLPPAASVVEPAPLFPAHQSTLPGVETIGSAENALEPAAAEIADAASLPAGVADRLPPLYSRLEEMGVSDPQLAAWGSRGQMFRFCCRASLAGTPALTRHFEAVAAEPISAVEQVVAKVEAWRTFDTGETAIR